MNSTPIVMASSSVGTSTVETTTTVAAMRNTTTLSEDVLFQKLVEYNDAKATLYIPVIVYMVVLTLVGTFGNILVCCVYCCKPTKSSSHFFILALAVLDLLTCVIGMPTEITDLRFPYMFYASAACKLLRFIESVTTIGSSMILIAVAVDRFLRICKLGKMISVRAAKRICVLALFVGVALSWPACFIFGQSTEELEPNVWGVDCSTDDSMHGTLFPPLYYGFLGLLFICCLIFFSVIYIQIGLQIWRQKKAKIGHKHNRDSEYSTKSSRAFSNSSTRDSHTTDGEETDKADTPVEHGSDPISTDNSSEQMNNGYTKKKSAKDRKFSAISTASVKSTSTKRTIKVTRTTVVLFAVTVAYVISYLPFLILMTVRSVKKDFEDNLSSAEEVLFKFCVKSYFINNAINPIIYSFFNINFRKDARKMIKRIFGCCCFCRRKSASWLNNSQPAKSKHVLFIEESAELCGNPDSWMWLVRCFHSNGQRRASWWLDKTIVKKATSLHERFWLIWINETTTHSLYVWAIWTLFDA